MTTGSETRIEPAAKYPQSEENCPTIICKPTGSVYRPSLFMKVAARINSFQPVINENSAVTATAGFDNGRIILQNIICREAPSMSAASSSSMGIVSK